MEVNTAQAHYHEGEKFLGLFSKILHPSTGNLSDFLFLWKM